MTIKEFSLEKLLSLHGKRAAIYVRVSTDAQEAEGTSLEIQTENCLELAKKAGLVVVEIFREVLTARGYRERPELTKLRQMARNDEIDIIIINTLDRLSRKQAHTAVLIDEMEHMGIKLLCALEDYDETTEGQFMRAAKAFVAEVEREKISQRTESGRKRRVQNGKINPGCKAPYGYKWETNKKERCIIDKVEGVVVERMVDLYLNERKGLKAIADILTAEKIPTPRGGQGWYDSTIRRIFTNPTYMGAATSFKWDTKTDIPGKYIGKLKPVEEQMKLPEGTYPPIISEVDFKRLQERLQTNAIDSSRNSRNSDHAVLRAGFIRCGYCKRIMNAGSNNSHYVKGKLETREYRCRNKYSGAIELRCKPAPTISIKRIDAEVWNYVGEIVQDFSLVEEAVKLLRELVKNISEEHNIKSIENSLRLARINQDQLIKDLKEVGADGHLKLKGRARDLLLDDIQKTDEYLASLEEERRKIIAGEKRWNSIQEDIDKFLEWCLTARETYATATVEEKRRALRVLGIQVFICREDDQSNKRFDIKVGLPDVLIRHKSWISPYKNIDFLLHKTAEGSFINPALIEGAVR